MTVQRLTEIPAEWSDPHHLVPNMAQEARGWLTQLRTIQRDVDIAREQLRLGFTLEAQEHLKALGRSMDRLSHEIGSRVQAYLLIAEEFRREREGQ